MGIADANHVIAAQIHINFVIVRAVSPPKPQYGYFGIHNMRVSGINIAIYLFMF